MTEMNDELGTETGPEPTRTRVHAYFTGRVQGVYFRANTRTKARELGLDGWVRNLPDGRVEAVFEGTQTSINIMITWCKNSMPLARVISVDQEIEDPEGIKGFDILR
jgi:acylphosphatase